MTSNLFHRPEPLLSPDLFRFLSPDPFPFLFPDPFRFLSPDPFPFHSPDLPVVMLWPKPSFEVRTKQKLPTRNR
jgi:hypothetical protein